MTRQHTAPPAIDDNARHNVDDECGVTVEYISREEGTRLLDEQARKYLGMSGEEFKRRYREGTIEDPERGDVVFISMLIPLAET